LNAKIAHARLQFTLDATMLCYNKRRARLTIV